METLPSYDEARAFPPRSVTQARLEIKALEMTKRREASAEEWELIEMRYQQALALIHLEELFAEGQLNCF